MTTPCGQRHYPTAQAAREGAVLRGLKSFVIISDPRRGEFAYVSPAQFFMSRAVQAVAAGIQVVEAVS